jgi:outer membrane protein
MRQSLLILLSAITVTAHAQSRIGYISMSELIQAMPEYKKADSAMTNYQDALYQH